MRFFSGYQVLYYLVLIFSRERFFITINGKFSIMRTKGGACLKKLVIFDFDGTIIDTESYWYKAYRGVIQKQYNFDLPLEMFSRCIGTTDSVLFEYLESEISESMNRQKINQDVDEFFLDISKDITVRKGVENLLFKLTEAGCILAIASSSKREWIRQYLEAFQLSSYFSLIKGKEDVLNVKPDPALYLAVLEELEIKPEEALVIEDSINGSTAALRAGIDCIVVTNPVTEHMAFDSSIPTYSCFTEITLNCCFEKA